jgi:hypothetical protein
MVQRLCGICPVSHHLAAAKALDRVVGALPVPPSADKIRRLMHYGQVMQSMRCTSSTWPAPTCCSASTASRRGATSSAWPRRTPTSPEGHPAAQVRPGGDSRHRRQACARHRLGARRHEPARQRGRPRAAAGRRAADAGLGPGSGGPGQALHAANPALYRGFGASRANMLSLVRADGALELYDGVIRARDAGPHPARRCQRPGLPRPDRGRGQALDLHEVPLPQAAWGATWAGTAWGRWRGCRTATSSPARWPRRSAANSSTGARAKPSTRRWPTTGRA